MRRVLLALLLLALVLPGRALAGPGMLVGVGDDAGKWTIPTSTPTAEAVRGLNLPAVRVSVAWTPGASEISGLERANVERAVTRAWGMRTVLALTGPGVATPQDDAARDQVCSFARSLLVDFPSVDDVVIWNEVNKQMFWRPQFNPDGTSASPAAYEALLARCYDVLHAYRPGVNVITSTSFRGNDDPDAVSNVSHSPGMFVRKLGDAYRASGRTQPIFDTLGHNPYPLDSAERPWRSHPGGQVFGEGDYASLMQAAYDAFAGTDQPVPGQGRVSLWYLEDGFQTVPDPAKAALYGGAENEHAPLPAASGGDVGPVDVKSHAPDQATQLVDAVRLAYCEPAVGAFFNFMAIDEASLVGWQSGLLWADATPKPSYAAYKAVAAEVAAGQVDCTRLKGGPAPSFRPLNGVAVSAVTWPRRAPSFSITTGEDALYRAALIRTGRKAPIATVTGHLDAGVATVVRFPVHKLGRVRYRVRLELTSAAWSSRQSTLQSSTFRSG